MSDYICIDIGGTAIKYAVLNSQAEILTKNHRKTQAHLGAEKVIENVFNIIDIYVSDYKISGVAISTAGMVDCEKGEVFFAGETMPGYSNTAWKKIIEGKYGILCEVENDVNCAALAEYVSGEGKGSSKLLCLTIGTGIGGAFMIEGDIYHGHSYSALEVGYMSLGDDNFQNLASTSSLCRYVEERKKGSSDIWDGYKIMEAFNAGDNICIEAVEYMCRNLSKGLANLIYILNPDRIVLGGGIMEQSKILKPIINKYLAQYLNKQLMDELDLRLAAQGNEAGIIGAFYMFKSKIHGRNI